MYECMYFLPTHSEMLTGALQAPGSFIANVAFTLKPRPGSFLSFTRTHKHFLLLSRTCFRLLQHSGLAFLTDPSMKVKQLVSPISWSEHSALSLAKSHLTNPTKQKKITNIGYGKLLSMANSSIGREEERMGLGFWGGHNSLFGPLYRLWIPFLKRGEKWVVGNCNN